MLIFIIKNIRKNKNISLYKLSQLTGLSRTYLRNIENNTLCNPTLQCLETIANALNVRIKHLFYELNELDKLKEEMYKRIELFGINSEEVLEVSQTIDLLINVDFSKRNKNNEEQ